MFRERQKPRVFLGAVGVVPKDKVTSFFEGIKWRSEQHMDAKLQSSLGDIFSLPLAADVEIPKPTDLSLDVFIQTYKQGALMDFNLGDAGFPMFWRPKIVLRARLSKLETAKVLKTYSVTEKATWREYLTRAASFRSVFRIGDIFEETEMKSLLERASARLLQDVIRTAY